jgi:hypothetical protein
MSSAVQVVLLYFLKVSGNDSFSSVHISEMSSLPGVYWTVFEI